MTNVEIGQPAAQTIVEGIDVFLPVEFAGLINRLREGVSRIQGDSVTGTLPDRSSETVVTAALAVLAVIDRSKARRQTGEVSTVLDQVSGEPVHVVLGIQVPAHRTDIVHFCNRCARQRSLNSEEPVLHVRRTHISISDGHARLAADQTAAGQQAGLDPWGERIVVRRIRSGAQGKQRLIGSTLCAC